MVAPSSDCAVPSLLCAEDEAIFDDNNEYVGNMEFDHQHRKNRIHDQNINFDRKDEEEGLLLLNEECLGLLFEKEDQYLPSPDYLRRLKNGDLDFASRKDALDWISKANAHFCFGPLCSYLAINYLDRFLSAYELPKGNAWTMQLLAVACLSLAAKSDETEVPLPLDLQVDGSKFVFEARTIQRMELLVLSTLRWRMQAITPFSFIDHFLCIISDNADQSFFIRILSFRSIQLILSTIKRVDFLEFKPSVIAAAIAISIVQETQQLHIEKSISLLIQHNEKERAVKCMNLIKEFALISESMKDGRSTGLGLNSVPRSPSGVLDIGGCMSYTNTSDEHNNTVGSCANSCHYSSGVKRRRLNRPCCEV